MIEHPDWTPSELQQMHDLRILLDRKRGGVMFKTKPSRAQQFVLDEWMRENGPKPPSPPTREPLIHWPAGVVSKIYVGVLLFGFLVTLFAGLNGGLPEKTPEQRKPWFERYIEPMLPNSVQEDLGNRRWRDAIAALPPEQRELIEQHRAFAVPTDNPDAPVELLPVDEGLAAEIRAGRAFLVPQVTKPGEPKAYGVVYREPPTAAASPQR